MTSREQFEAYYASLCGMQPEEIQKLRYEEGYVSVLVCAEWNGWQASRAALVIKLPAPHTDYDNYRDSEVTGACKHYDAARKAIEAAGLKVAP